MSDIARQILARPIQLADRLAKATEDAHSFKLECTELGAKAKRLASILRRLARAGSNLYDRPTRRIAGDAEAAIRRAMVLVQKCQAHNSLVRRVFTMMIPVASVAFRKASAQLEDSVGNASWLLQVASGGGNPGLPPIAANEPILCIVWEQIAALHSNRVERHPEAAAALEALARDNGRYGAMIVDEGGVPPLLRMAREGRTAEGRESAVKAISLLGRAEKISLDRIVKSGIGTTFAKILRQDQHVKVQAAVAWAVSELAMSHPKSRDHFLHANVVQLLVSHLVLETDHDQHHKYGLTVMKKPKVHSIASEIIANGNMNNHVRRCQLELLQYNHQQVMISSGGREAEDQAAKAELKAMAVKALWHLVKGHPRICRVVTDSKALVAFAELLQQTSEGDIRLYSAEALMEIAAVAEYNSEIRRTAFKPTSPEAKAVVEQLMRVLAATTATTVENVLVPCIRAIGSLARTFRATETAIISPLVGLLDGPTSARVKGEAAAALAKFACTANFLHVNHCRAIVGSGGASHLAGLVYNGDRSVQVPALVLLCYIAIHVPNSEPLARENALAVVEWAAKQADLTEDSWIKPLLAKAQGQLELYQSRSS
ncbi:hypothetical protein SAY87_002724 [Trapa incisa]|uniref:DUF7792 domain-containing protein n=1 Tax=Trapa incisa TaxID=236973 RepID=A0AAN7JTK4_9MYRT|nr:hypothetical protein SAY87_002724 [Trapa incisa]